MTQVVLLHGWGFNHTVWNEFLLMLPEDYEVMVPDLIGYGRLVDEAFEDYLTALENHLWPQIKSGAILIGWSLGGIVALQLALRFPNVVKKIILLASTPCFVAKTDYLIGVSVEIFEEFTQRTKENPSASLQRFVNLLTTKLAGGKMLRRKLQEVIASYPIPEINALLHGLAILKQTDLRLELANQTCPILMILGDDDPLIPKELADEVMKLSRNIQVRVIQGTGHLPFLVYPQQVAHLITAFINES